MYFNNKNALELLVGNFKIIAELEEDVKHAELLNKFDVNYSKYDVEL